MTLSEQQIKDIILHNPNKGLIEKGVAYNKKMRLHLYGEGLSDNLTKIEGYEADSLHNLKVKYARSNKDIFTRLGRPIDKVFTARGGSIYYNLPDSQDKAARSLALNIRNGHSVRNWVEHFWKPHFLDDPYGLVFLEIMPSGEAVKAQKEGKAFVYPTYKSICAVYDYLPKGSQLEYIVFKVEGTQKKRLGIKDEVKVYRVVDDSFDYLVKREGDEVTILQEQTLPNYFKQVPGQLNSDLIDPQNEDCVLSLYDSVIELANHFLLKGAIKLTHEFLHGFPKYWQYADGCRDCGGSKYVGGETCKTCNGSGQSIMVKVSDAMLLAMPSKDEPAITPNVAGYVSPDKTYWEIATTDLQALEELMHITLWGTPSKSVPVSMSTDKGGDQKTATEVMDDMQPKTDRLYTISAMAEKRHKFILDNTIRLQITPTYRGSSVNYGRRYMMEGPDKIWEKYSEARQKGSPVSVLDDLLIEYYEAKYQNDEVALAIALKLMYVEPFVHDTKQQVDAMQSVSFEDKVSKVYFSEWLAIASESEILVSEVVDLKAALLEFAKAKNVKEPEPAKPAA